MTISLSDTGKRYNRDWIFRHLSYQFLSGNAYAITGSNGSGKSTLLQAISGSLLINEGSIRYEKDDTVISDENIYRYVSLCAPYLELIEEMTATELLDFQQAFKPFLPHFDTKKLLQIAGLEGAAQKQIRYFSSGMKQRLKLIQAFASDTPILLLDEPCTNLDQEGIALYQLLLQQHTDNRIVIISSNDPVEYAHCTARIAMGDYK
ncbi:MAG: ATP-binding cassette domain-containing protein [Sphingomonadales bacterium]|nr:ATP-binding cassette domain-containing protein [Sphingomonadales bacterium]